MTRLSGVVIDYFDDRGETLKKIFPTLADVPDIIKTASVPDKEKIHDPAAFALILADRGHVMHKFACIDAGTTAMSTIYFMEHGDKLPEEAQKVAATNLTRACLQYGLVPPLAMVKMADIEGGRPPSEDEKVEIRNWLRGHNNPSDEMFHAFLESKGIKPSLGEPVAYDFAHELSKSATDTIAGGKADDMPSSEFPKSQIEKGKKVEMEHTKNPQLAEEIARDHLEEFKDYYTRLDKMEEEAKAEKKGSVVDITGKAPKSIVKKASPKSDEDYAVILPDGTRHYPIHNWNMVKKAEVYFQEEQIRMEPEIRRQFAKNLTKKAHSIGYPIDVEIANLGASRYNSQGHLKQAIEMRKIACAPGSSREFLDELFEKRAEIQPEVYAECLRRFDVEQGLDRGWDHVIPDPWFSTFGISKTAAVVWELGPDRVTEEALKNLAINFLYLVQDQFTYLMANEFRKDPLGVFNSMPLPQKRLLARLANDAVGSGESEHYLVDGPSEGKTSTQAG